MRILMLNYEFPPLGETVSTLLSIFILGSENCFRGISSQLRKATDRTYNFYQKATDKKVRFISQKI